MEAYASTRAAASGTAGDGRATPRSRWPTVPAAAAALPVVAVRTLRRHAAFVVVLALAISVRLVVTSAYPSAFYFPDSVQYVELAKSWAPDPSRPLGYPLFLKLFLVPFGSPALPYAAAPYETIALIQHALIIGLIVAGYVFLVHFGVARWLAAVAMIPMALDGREIALERHVISETLFIVLLAGGLMILARRGRLSTAWACVGGFLVAAAATVRAVGLPIVVVVLAYLALRRVSWRAMVGFAATSGLVLLGYMAYYQHFHGAFTFGQSSGRALAARASSIADCDRLVLTTQQRAICPTDPAWQYLERPDAYGSSGAAMTRLYPSPEDDAFLGDFAKTVIRQQPGDYLRVVAIQSAWHFLPWPPVNELGQCVIKSWKLPASPNLRCQARMYTESGPVSDDELVPVAPTRLTTGLARYSDIMFTPGPLLGAGVLVAFAGLFHRRGGDRSRRGLAGALFAGTGLLLVVISVATGMYEMRYLMPGLFLIPVGAALGIQQLLGGRRPPGAEAAPHLEGRAA